MICLLFPSLIRSGSGYSRASGRSAQSGYSGTSWSSHKSHNSGSPATEL